MKYNCIRNSDSPEVMRARVKHGIAAYGIYVALMQLLEEDEDHKLSKDYSMIAYEMRVDVSVVQSVVEDFDLFEVEEEYFYSKELSDTIEQARKVSEARARAGRAGGAAKARNFVANAKESSSKCQANASESLANATNSLANASESLANAKQMPESKESSPNPSKNIYSVPTEREDNIKLSSPSSARTRKSKPKEFTICHKGRQIFEKYYQELYDSAYYWQPKDAKAMNSILKKISFARSHKTVPLPIDDESLLKALEEFLRRIDKTWIMNNFSVNKIDSQYNEIVSEMKNHRQNVTDNGNNTKTGWKAPDHKDTSAYRSGFGVAVGK
ncbi:Lin1244/Lin1753 domain-containing protein [Prevotella sp.]